MSKYDVIKVGLETPDLHSSIHIGIANISVSDNNIEVSYLGKPNISRKRIKPFADLLNHISKYKNKNGEKIDVVVFPEVSIPFSWESMLVSWARKHRIGVICGFEHRIKKGIAYNEVFAALPYKAKNKHWGCMPIRRVKKLYSPEEIFILENEGLAVPNDSNNYHLYQWRGASFAIYNCFELTSIEDRSLFKGKADFIVGTEFNKDINYFSNIVEAASRDLHCYVIQVNSSQYGDSRVISPSKSIKMNPLRIKGGENLTFLTMNLDLKSLRTHQRKGYGLQKESDDFKPTPPGLKAEDVKARINLGKL